MANKNGKKKGKKGKTTGLAQGGGKDTTVSPTEMLESLKSASPEELEAYLKELHSVCEAAKAKEFMKVGDTLNYDDQLPGTSTESLGPEGIGLQHECDTQAYYAESSVEDDRNSAEFYYPPAKLPPLPPREFSLRSRVVRPPPLPPRDPLDPIYDYTVHDQYLFINVKPPLPPRLPTRTPTRIRSRSPLNRSPAHVVSNVIDVPPVVVDTPQSLPQTGNPGQDKDVRDVSTTSATTALRDGQPDDPMAVDPAHLSSIIQDMLGVSSQSDKGDFLNSYMLCGFNLDTKIKAKIVAKEYVELATLWDQDECPARVNMSVSNDDHTQLSFMAAKPREPASIYEWSHLFYVYATVYASYHPKEAGSLFSYMRRIQDMQKDNPTTYIWRIYDVKFRQAKAKFHELPWHIIISPMQGDAKSAYFRGLANKKDKKPAGNTRFGTPTTVKRRVKNSCDRWNGGSCTNQKCRFLHVCANCGRGSHTVLTCNSSTTAPPVDSAPTPTTTAPRSK